MTGTASLTAADTYRDSELYAIPPRDRWDPPTYATFSESRFVIGTLEGVTGVLDTAAGPTASLSERASVREALARVDDDTAVVGFASERALDEVLDELDLDEWFGGSMAGSLVTVSSSRTVCAAFFDNSTEATAFYALVTGFLGSAQSVIDELDAAANGQDNLVAEFAVRLLQAVVQDAVDNRLRAELSGTEVVLTADGPPAMAWIGTMAIPAIMGFQSYTQRSLTTEATMNVRRLFDSSVSYYDTDHVTADGTILLPQFPASVPRTPASVPCGTTVWPDQSHWTAQTWEALNFAVSDPHRYSYQYESQGIGVGATFTAYAFGDLDCDGVLSTFLRTGEVTAGNEIRGGAGLYVENELE